MSSSQIRMSAASGIVRADAYGRMARTTGRWVDAGLLRVFKRPGRMPDARDYLRVHSEILAGYGLYANGGHTAMTFHDRPPPPSNPTLSKGWHPKLRYEQLTFDSDYELPLEDVAGARWRSYTRNRTAHAWVARQPDPSAPWMICLHGLGTGTIWSDVAAFRAHSLYHDHGLNLLMPVLPLHGPRKERGMATGSLLSFELMDAFHGICQAVWDVRRAMHWARAQGATRFGVYGLSMGAYVASLLSGLEQCDMVMSGIPLTDIPDLFVHHASMEVRQQAEGHHVLGSTLRELFQLISPMQVEPTPPAHRRFIFAGSDDLVTTPEQAERLWEHWGEPTIRWFAGGHVSFFWSSAVDQFVAGVLSETGFSAARGPQAA